MPDSQIVNLTQIPCSINVCSEASILINLSCTDWSTSTRMGKKNARNGYRNAHRSSLVVTSTCTVSGTISLSSALCTDWSLC